MAGKAFDYKAKMQELQTLLADMQVEDLDVDLVIKKYEHGKKLTVELQRYLKTAENKITKRKLPKIDEGS